MNNEKYIQRCLELAQKGKGLVSPNPMVGCVLVKNDLIIGEGYHHIYGGPHAEVEAVNSVKDQTDIEGATAYVSLEPCAHHGKTPPCANLLVKKGVSKVVICNRDPYSEVDGKGLKILQDAGIEVESGLLVNEGRYLNRFFFTYHEKQRPHVILKWAQTRNGFIAPSEQLSGHQTAISNVFTNQQSHRLRSEVDAILIGKNTFLKDKPQLNVRYMAGQAPVRVILDSQLEALSDIENSFQNQGKTLVMNQVKSIKKNDHLELILCDMSAQDILRKLYTEKILSVLVEGGRQVLQHFIEHDIWDEAIQIEGDLELTDGIAAPQLPAHLRVQKSTIANDRLTHYHHA